MLSKRTRWVARLVLSATMAAIVMSQSDASQWSLSRQRPIMTDLGVSLLRGAAAGDYI